MPRTVLKGLVDVVVDEYAAGVVHGRVQPRGEVECAPHAVHVARGVQLGHQGGSAGLGQQTRHTKVGHQGGSAGLGQQTRHTSVFAHTVGGAKATDRGSHGQGGSGAREGHYKHPGTEGVLHHCGQGGAKVATTATTPAFQPTPAIPASPLARE